MTVSAPAAVRDVAEEYKRFLRTSFRFLDEHLREQFERHLQGMDVLARGPYVTLARDFVRGACLRDLAAEGVLHPSITEANWPFGEEPLYLHQEQAARAGTAGRPFLISTGTCSRKTEGFFVQGECPSLHENKITPHVLRHTAAMQLLHAGVDTTVIALWLGHERVDTTQIYPHADLSIKERALARTTPPHTPSGRYRPPDSLLAFLESPRLCRPLKREPRHRQRLPRPSRHNPEVGVMDVMPTSA